MTRTAKPVILTLEERQTLEPRVRGRNLPHRQMVRAKSITMAADGGSNQDIAKSMEVSRPNVQLWREHFLALLVNLT